MSTGYCAVLFDMDGTLVDTAPDFILASNELRRACNLPLLPAASIAAEVSNGAVAVTRVTFAMNEDHSDFPSRRQDLLDCYEKHLGSAATLYPGLDDLLAQLEQCNVHWGVVTNKPVRYAEPLLHKLGLGQRCSALVCPDHVEQRKPHPEGLLLAARQLGTDAARCIYAGDHIRDIDAGRAAGMLTLAAAFGYLAADDDVASWNADLVANTSAEMAAQVLARI